MAFLAGQKAIARVELTSSHLFLFGSSPTQHIRWILFTLPHDLTSVQLLINTYFPRPPLSTAAQVSTSALSPDELKKHATQRAIISAVFTFVKNFVASYEGPPDA